MTYKELIRSMVESSQQRNELLRETNFSLRRIAHYLEENDNGTREQNYLLKRLADRVEQQEIEKALKEGRARRFVD